MVRDNAHTHTHTRASPRPPPNCRDTRVFTIDPPTAKDLDDALHITPLPGGGCRVGVHIADVAHFIPPFSALDVEAGMRATSVYLTQRVGACHGALPLQSPPEFLFSVPLQSSPQSFFSPSMVPSMVFPSLSMVLFKV